MSKEIKTILKEIREAIKNKNNVDAIKKCEDLLSIDPNNYMGLVLMGAAYQEKDKKIAAKYLKHAVEVAADVDPTLALQGLSNCADIADLPNIYQRLLTLLPTKFQDYHEKLVGISNVKNFNECCDILKSETDLEDNDNNTRRESALLSLGKVFSNTKQLPENFDQNFIILALEKVIDSECGSITEVSCLKLYFKVLYKNNSFDKLLRKASEMEKKHPNEVNPLEWICQVYSTHYKNIDTKNLIEQPVDYYANKLFSMNQSSKLAILVRAIIHFQNKQYVQARNFLVQIKDISDPIKEMLAEIYMKIGAYGLAENLYRELNIKSLDFGLCLCYSDDTNVIQEGTSILEELNKNEFTLYALGRAYFKMKNEERLKKTLQELENFGNEDLIKIFQMDFMATSEEKIAILETITSHSSFELELRKGKLYLELKQYEKSLLPLLKSTEIKPYFADCFLYLGILYNSTNNDIRARKCFEKCINLNPCCELAISYLCAIYRKNEEWNLNASLLSGVVGQLQGCQAKWALFQQSLNFLDMEEYEKAIKSLRLTIRYDPTNILYWEILADSYLERGSYNSAMKVYENILEQNPDHKYAKLQVAIIKSTRRMYSESIQDFAELLSLDNKYLPALKGVAEAHYQFANHLLQQRLLGSCKDNLQAALDYLQKIFLNYQNKNFIWLWRLTANIFTLVACLPSKLSYLRIYGILARQENQNESVLNRKDLFELALKFYTRALKLNQNESLLWQELSLCAYFYILHEENSDKKKLIQLAQNACKSSIKCAPNRWQTWNLLGVLYAINVGDLQPNYSLAQHYFIKALQIDKNSAVTWGNLGVIYFHIKEIKLANKAFTRSQESDPTYINGWLGQAMIAEFIGENEEALDLFRHCTQLDFHVESALGYSHWICSTLSNDKLLKIRPDTHAISQATDSINWYRRSEDDKSSVESLSYYGYLFSNQKLWSSAIKAYELAVQKAEGEQKDSLLFNLGYCYLNAGKSKLASETFSNLSEATMKSTIGLALSLRQSKDFHKSYEIYGSAFEWLTTTDEEKAQILVAMSAIVYSLEGEKDTKSILYQCLDLEPRPMEAMFSACALGIIHSDLQLAESIIDELKKFEDNVEYCHHVAFLTSQYYYARRQSKKAYFYLISKVHIHPERPLLRKVLADFLINYLSKTKKYSKGTCQIAQSVIALGHKSAIRNDSLEAARAFLTASEAMKNVDKKKQKKLIQQSIHLHPSFQLAWNALVSVKV